MERKRKIDKRRASLAIKRLQSVTQRTLIEHTIVLVIVVLGVEKTGLWRINLSRQSVKETDTRNNEKERQERCASCLSTWKRDKSHETDAIERIIFEIINSEVDRPMSLANKIALCFTRRRRRVSSGTHFSLSLSGCLSHR